MKRISSGNAELDTVLGGGFPANSINLIMGLPGTGKTILAEMVVFTNARPDAKALYIGTVSEPLDKMLHYAQEFSFFDAGRIGEAVIYADLRAELRSGGVRGFVQGCMDLIKHHLPSIVVIDSFKALHAFCEPTTFRRDITDLMLSLSSLAITSFLVGEYASDDIGMVPEAAVADGIIELVLHKVGVRDVRYLRVIKERGSSFATGEHAIRLSEHGIRLFPRLSSPPEAIRYPVPDVRSETGVPVLDAMLLGGLWKGSSTLVFGPPGSGKTLLGLHFLVRGIEMGEKAMLATMEENPSQLRRIMAGFGWNLDELLESGMLDLYYVSPVDIYIDEFMSTVADRARGKGVGRLMIDSANDLEAASPDPSRFRDFMYSLVQALAVEGISVYMTHEVTNLFSTSVLSQQGISHMSDNVLLIHYLRQESEIKRAISAIKTRGSEHDQRIRQFDITSSGITIGGLFGDSDFDSFSH